MIDLINRFMATGDVASAQSIIIEELNTQPSVFYKTKVRNKKV